ncbi:MAG: AAA family ATPase [Candidatus Omnitrophica bacterium]|nr:AAA family ATPase [Candidatus Omnitrophota bacterium]MBU1933111.1 AAA family ATPase [Candidatus Omnitrophota bacterium]
MYEKYWKLDVKPFSNTPDPRFLYLSSQHEDVMMKLSYCIVEKMGAGLLTGVFGCGKTLLGKAILKELGEDKYKAVFINNPQVTYVELLRAIVRNLKSSALPSRADELLADPLLETLHNILLDNMRDGKETVIIIDEAHIIQDERIFEELRLLLNFQLEDRFLLTLILSGQPELKNKIADLRQFEQRIAICCHLDALSEKDTQEYVLHRIKIAGGKNNIFTLDAIKFIHDRSGGIPRRINRMCDLALLTGFGKKLTKIDKDVIKQVGEDFGV